MNIDKEWNHQSEIKYPKVNLSQIDVTDRVMQAISRSRAPKKKVWFVIGMATIVILASGFGYAAASWKLFEADGSVALEYRQFMPGDEPVESANLDELRSLIPEGEAALFYIKQDGQFLSLANERVITSYEEFRMDAGNSALPERIGNEYKFSQGTFNHEPIMEHGLMDELMLAAGSSDEPYLYRSVGMGDMTGYYAEFLNEAGSRVTLSGLYGERWSTVNTNLEPLEMIKLQLGDKEAFYMTNEAAGTHQVVWRDSTIDQPVYYELTALMEGGLTAEELKDAALSIIAAS